MNRRLKLGIAFMLIGCLLFAEQPTISPLLDYLVREYTPNVPIMFKLRGTTVLWMLDVYPNYLPVGMNILFASLVFLVIGTILSLASKPKLSPVVPSQEENPIRRLRIE